MTERTHFTENDETFTVGTYNGISIIIRDKDGYINATKLCNDGKKDFRQFRKNKRGTELFEYFDSENKTDGIPSHYNLHKNYNKMKGYYVNPKPVHFVADYVNFKYALTVAKIMDTINNLVHVELHKNNLPDTPTTAEPILNKIEKSLKQKLLDEMKTIEDIDSYKYRDLQANYNASDEKDNFNINIYNKSLEDSSNKMF
jgi:hypothetical protein